MVLLVDVFSTKRIAEVILVAPVNDGAVLTKTNAVQPTADQMMLLTESGSDAMALGEMMFVCPRSSR